MLGTNVGTPAVDEKVRGTFLLADHTRYAYNMRGLASVTDPVTRVTSFVRDNRGRAQFITDTANSVTDFDYDFYDNLFTRTGPDPDGNGQLSRPVFRYTYDALDRRTSQVDPRNGTTRLEYDAASNLVSVTDPVSNMTQFGYDSWNRRTIANQYAESQSRSFVYDTAGNLTRTVDRNGRIIQYVYDALDRTIDERWQQTGTVNPSLTVTTVRL